MLSVALTGGIGCGKSTVCDLFAAKGVPIIDTDIIAREVVQPGSKALGKIKNYFGSSILLPDGSLNRKELASKVFNNETSRLYLESILHPLIRRVIDEKTEQLSATYVIIAIPLLIETNQQMNYDRVLVIDCNEQQQVERTLKRDQRDLNEINSIMKSQVSREKRLQVADDIINNSLPEDSLKGQIMNLHEKYIHLSDSKSCT